MPSARYSTVFVQDFTGRLSQVDRPILKTFHLIKKIISSVRTDNVFHLSGYANGPRDVMSVPIAYHSLLTSTVTILTLATHAECKKINLAGSQEEPENDSSFAGSPYAVAKWSARNYAKMFSNLYQIPVINPRIFMVYGPAQRKYKKLIPYVILSFLKNEAPKRTNGSRPVDWIYIDDVIDALIHGVVSNLNIDIPFHIGTGIQVTVIDIVNKVIQIMGSPVKPLFGFHADRPLERITRADADNMLLEPKVSLDEGLYRTVQWVKRNFIKITDSDEYLQICSA